MTDPIDRFTGEYRFLSNFYPVRVRYPDYDSPHTLWFPSTEHAYQAAKSLDPDVRKQIQMVEWPSEAKKIGSRLRLRPGWNPHTRVTIMASLLRQKFSVVGLREQLLATAPSELIEGNEWHDQFWGDCRCAEHIGQGGLNWLGTLLMQLRDIEIPALQEQDNR